MKFSLHHALIILLAGMLLVLFGAFFKNSNSVLANPVILSGLAFAFLGTLWLVLYLNQRRKKK